MIALMLLLLFCFCTSFNICGYWLETGYKGGLGSSGRKVRVRGKDSGQFVYI